MPLTRQPTDDAFTPWQPQSFDKADREHPAEAGTDQTTEGTKETPVEPAGPTPEEIEAAFTEAREQGRSRGYEEGREEGLEQGRNEGLEAGREEGYKSGWDKGHKEATLQARRLKQLVEAMDRSLDALDAEVARELISLATALSREMVGRSLALQPEAVASTAREALQHIPQGKVQIHLHPDDVALVREHLKDQLEAGHHRLVVDRDITRGGCRMESGTTDVDATVESRWQRVLRGIGLEGPEWHAAEHPAEDEAGAQPAPDGHA